MPGTSPYDGSSLTFSTLVLGMGEFLCDSEGADWASEKWSSDSDESVQRQLVSWEVSQAVDEAFHPHSPSSWAPGSSVFVRLGGERVSVRSDILRPGVRLKQGSLSFLACPNRQGQERRLRPEGDRKRMGSATGNQFWPTVLKEERNRR